ncbi:MAG: hypothetical protein N2C14_25250, partial [Planctomycetales bacterium]
FIVAASAIGAYVAWRSGRRELAYVAIFISVGTVAGLVVCSLSSALWVGSSELEVKAFVIDASTLAPIANAQIQEMDGPSSPLEGHHWIAEHHMKPSGRALPGSQATDQYGRVMFKHRFHATGRINAFEDSGYVQTNNVWLRVTAKGYATTFLPLDRQGARARDLHDLTPLYATVPMGKQQAPANSDE